MIEHCLSVSTLSSFYASFQMFWNANVYLLLYFFVQLLTLWLALPSGFLSIYVECSTKHQLLQFKLDIFAERCKHMTKHVGVRTEKQWKN